MIENIGEARTSIQDFAQMLQKKVWTVNNDHLRLSLLMVRLKDEKLELQKAQERGDPISLQKPIQRCINRCYTEIFRRVSVAMAVFTFTLMGCAFGISINRFRSKRGRSPRGSVFALWLASFKIPFLSFFIIFFRSNNASALSVEDIYLYCLVILPPLLTILLLLLLLFSIARGIFTL